MRRILSWLLLSALPGAALGAPPDVVSDIPPVNALVAQVMGDLGTPHQLLTKGANEHDFQLRPSQAQQIADAGLVVWVGPELTPWLDRALLALAPQTPTLALLGTPDANRLPQDGADEHDHSATDPHAWLDPDTARAWLVLIAAELARLDPENAATYAANAKTADQSIAALDATLAAQLAPIAARPFVTQHDAYGHFTAHFGLTTHGSVALGDASGPGAARITALAQTLRTEGTICLFPEAQHDPALLEQLAKDASARVGRALDPAGSLQDPGPGAYAATLQAIADTLTDCLDAPRTP